MISHELMQERRRERNMITSRGMMSSLQLLGNEAYGGVTGDVSLTAYGLVL